MKSMTGFGNNQGTTKSVTIEVSVRTVNGRFMEPRMHLPRELLKYESQLRETLGKYILRGTVDVFVSRRIKNDASQTQIEINHGMIKKYLAALKQISAQHKISNDVSMESIIKLPDTFNIQVSDGISKPEEQLLFKVFESACKACNTEREREGKSLKNELNNLLKNLLQQVNQISEHREQANKMIQNRLEEKINARLGDSKLDPQRLAQELVIQLEKSDINEELVRLEEHIKNYKSLITRPEVEGKKLDFYTQELLREINTIGSKSQVAQITQSVVEAKTIIERLREQVQNIQ